MKKSVCMVSELYKCDGIRCQRPLFIRVRATWCLLVEWVSHKTVEVNVVGNKTPQIVYTRHCFFLTEGRRASHASWVFPSDTIAKLKGDNTSKEISGKLKTRWGMTSVTKCIFDRSAACPLWLCNTSITKWVTKGNPSTKFLYIVSPRTTYFCYFVAMFKNYISFRSTFSRFKLDSIIFDGLHLH